MCFLSTPTATTETSTLSLHDALPISPQPPCAPEKAAQTCGASASRRCRAGVSDQVSARSEEHTSELQSRQYLVCRLLLEKKKSVDLPQRRLRLEIEIHGRAAAENHAT